MASKIANLSHGVVLFKGMMQFALTSVGISFFNKVQEGLHLFQVGTRAHSVLLTLEYTGSVVNKEEHIQYLRK